MTRKLTQETTTMTNTEGVPVSIEMTDRGRRMIERQKVENEWDGVERRRSDRRQHALDTRDTPERRRAHI